MENIDSANEKNLIQQNVAKLYFPVFIVLFTMAHRHAYGCIRLLLSPHSLSFKHDRRGGKSCRVDQHS